jgi:hypothetical protein
VEGVCSILMDHGYLKATDVRGAGRPKVEYTLNPKFFVNISGESQLRVPEVDIERNYPLPIPVSKVPKDTFDTFDTECPSTQTLSFL